MNLDELKRCNLVDLLTAAWGMSFRKEGSGFVAHSPFRNESIPSFYAACEPDGHWVFCDHADGASGSIIDLMMRRENTSDFMLAMKMAHDLVANRDHQALLRPVADSRKRTVDLLGLYQVLRRHDTTACLNYLTNRKIERKLVESLIAQGIIVHNRHDGSDYCCFAVRDAAGGLRSLFNRKISGDLGHTRWLLGAQYPFCLNWHTLAEASEIYLCEAIIDALSLQTLQPDACVIAVPGANYDLAQLDLPTGIPLIEAFDADQAGRDAAGRLRTLYPEHPVTSYDLCGFHDLNDMLCQHHADKLSDADRLAIVSTLRHVPSRELAKRYGVHHSIICRLRSEADTLLLQHFQTRRPGRKPAAKSVDVDAVVKERDRYKREYELKCMSEDWLKLRMDLTRSHAIEAGQEEILDALLKKKAPTPPK